VADCCKIGTPLEFMMSINPQKKMPATPREALGPTIWETVIAADKEFTIGRPSETDKMLTHPEVLKDITYNEQMPYWAEIWPSARMLAKFMMKEQFIPNQKTLEIGCGLGLVGVVGLYKGLDVTFSDYDATALEFAADNARANGFENFTILQIDWRNVPDDLSFPLILASDLVYEPGNVDPLVKMIAKVLAPDGLCLMTDQDRIPAQLLRETLDKSGFVYTTQVLKAGLPGGIRYKGTLYSIRKV